MHTKSGILYILPTERRKIEILLEHARRDISYGSMGSYGDGQIVAKKEIKIGQEGIKLVEEIMEFTK